MTAASATTPAGYVPRRHGTLHLDGLRAETRITFEQWLEARKQRFVICDLSLGGWYPAQLAAEIAAQIGVTLPHDVSTALPLPQSEALDADTVGRWVDAEARGNTALRLAEHAMHTLLPGLADIAETVFVLVPPRAADWREADLWTLRLLANAQALGGFELILGCFGAHTPELPADFAVTWGSAASPTIESDAAKLLDPVPEADLAWLGLVPGIIAPPLAQALGLSPETAMQLILLPSGVAVIPGELRALAAANRSGAAQTLAERAAATPWLAASTAAQGVSQPAGLLLDQAWQAFTAGANDLAGALAGMAVAAAGGTGERVPALLSVQTMRLVNQDYAGLAAADATPADAPGEDRKRLERFRAWGRALTDDGTGALELLGEMPGDAPLDPQPWLDLYLRNIHALALFRIGDIEAALALELDIATRIDRLRPTPWQLRYLNALNLARLYRARGETGTAGEWLTIAEEATIGVALPADLIHFHVLRARFAADQTPQLARRHWYAAALIFAALPMPEAIGWRVAGAILGTRVETADPDAIAAALLQQIGTDIPASTGSETAPTFLLAEDWPPSGPLSAVGAPGWGVLIVEDTAAPPFDSPHHAALRRSLGRSLAVDRSGPSTVLVDLRFGRGLPDTLDALAGSALWYGAGHLVWEGDALDLDRTLLDAEQLLVRAPGVAEIAGTEVRFKRYRQPLQLPAPALPLANDTGRPVVSLSGDEQQLAATLVAQGVLAVETHLAPATQASAVSAHG